MNLLNAKKIMGNNFIGPAELNKISGRLNIARVSESDIPEIPFKGELIKKIKDDYLLILGLSKNKDGIDLTINNMRSFFGWEPEKSEPCLYSQDWYLKEDFAARTHLSDQWYLIKKEIIAEASGKIPDEVEKNFSQKEKFPPAVLTAFAFFAYYFHTGGEILWRHDFIWCSDQDSNGDRIYTGRYIDPSKINKNGFNIHRYLTIKPWYGAITQII